MKRLAGCLTVLFTLTIAIPVFAGDLQKAEKQAHKITAMATDATGRRIVSMTISHILKVKRPELVQERRDAKLNYGSLFIAHELTVAGAKMSDIAAQLQAGKTIFQIANDQHANWKQIAADTKKLNSKIEAQIYKHFLNAKADEERDQADKYDPTFDVVTADNDVTMREIEEAQRTYVLWRDRAADAQGTDKRLGIADENAAYYDHARSGGPQGGHSGSAGIKAPAAGGIPQ